MNSQSFKYTSCVKVEIFTSKSVQFLAKRFAISTFQTFYLAGDVGCIWLLTGQSQFVIVIVKRN